MPKPKAEQTRLAVAVALVIVLVAVVAVQLLRARGPKGGGRGGDRITYELHNLPVLESLEPAADAGIVQFSRNPFLYGVPPTPTPRPVTPVPTSPPVRRTPPPTATPRLARGLDGKVKPPPPPFDREYLGYFGPLQLQVAAFRKQGPDADIAEVEVAKVGDVLDGIFIVREIGYESVKIGFVGYDPSEDTRVPLAEK
jgi:hypothetical protein